MKKSNFCAVDRVRDLIRSHSDLTLLERLIEDIKDFNLLNKDGETMLFVAVMYENYDAIQLIFEMSRKSTRYKKESKGL